MFRADTHCHTNFSDGTEDPMELVRMAKESGLQGLAFTDHDDVSAHPYAISKGADIALLPGVELSCAEGQTSVHVLGYGFDVDAMHAVCKEYKQLRDERNEKMLARLQELGMPIDMSELISLGSLGRPQIALAMVKKGYVSSFRAAFDKWIGDRAPAFVQVDRYSPREGIEQIHSCGGFAVLAHPHLIENKALLKGLLTLDFDGIEACYGDFPKARSLPFEQIAQERGWFVTGGSDFHGSIKPHSRLGSSWTKEPIFTQMLEGRS